jgi:hypothetical protein
MIPIRTFQPLFGLFFLFPILSPARQAWYGWIFLSLIRPPTINLLALDAETQGKLVALRSRHSTL